MEVKAVSYEYKGHHNPYLALDDANTNLYAYGQKPYETYTTHYNTLQVLVEVLEYYGGSLCQDRTLMLLEMKNQNNKRTLHE